MQISFESPEKVGGVLTLTVEEGDYKADVEKKLKEYRRRAKHHRRLKTVEHHCPALCSFFRLRLSLQENTHRPFKAMGGKNRLARAER